ncbi:MerR family transcriptional regulator [Bailinhaonella thermotolerans]|uniref:MerR family transcriptional regulator n=1 Tax=Bailinhaonella thermotolerans TaxID=1070861 RepID=A0A3A3ZZB0_9ACTN|nr:MerR family transcriptional regulator [Bailinhaonella thermotolerans]RJL20524.1 MerR family transcriptional regulator [Bailinhaonella thermotolerans]
MKSSEMSIGELAERFGLAAHVLRHWESVGLLTPGRRVNGRRRYTEEHVYRVAVIVRAKDAGLSLERIGRLLAARDREGRRELLAGHLADLDRRIAEAQASRAMVEHAMGCPEEDFLRCPTMRSMIGVLI